MSTSQKFETFVPGTHSVRPIPFKAHKITDFSPEILEAHYEDVYGAAVRNLNEVEREVGRRISAEPPQHLENLKTDELRLTNEVLLHEVYFDGLGEDGGSLLEDIPLRAAIKDAFGSVTQWQQDTLTLAAPDSGNEWVVLAWSTRLGRLINLGLPDVSRGLFDAEPILALDMCSHAYTDRFGNDQAAYAQAYLRNIDWVRVARRFDHSILGGSSAPEPDDQQMTVGVLKKLIDQGEGAPLVIDVRHDDDRERYPKRIMETDWYDSFKVEEWAEKLPKNKPVVVYCMYGFWVSQKVAEELRAKGFNAVSLSGGVTAWRAMGYPSSDNVF